MNNMWLNINKLNPCVFFDAAFKLEHQDIVPEGFFDYFDHLLSNFFFEKDDTYNIITIYQSAIDNNGNKMGKIQLFWLVFSKKKVYCSTLSILAEIFKIRYSDCNQLTNYDKLFVRNFISFLFNEQEKNLFFTTSLHLKK